MTMTENKTIERLPVNEEFARPASSAAIERAAAALSQHGIDAQIVDDASKARELLLSLVPEGGEVGEGASMTLDQIGVTEIIEKSGRYDAVRPRMRSMDRATQMREIRKLGAAPDVQINSVQALTEDGRIVVASATGSQLGPIAFGAGRVILVVGAQKVVPDLATAFRRIEEYSYPIEDAKMQEAYGRHSAVNKMLVFKAEGAPGRTTVILVREPVGV
ncbi:MAG: LUD domain-containing protein [Candidatus Limnocylindrales bacterium]|jgi:acyl-CoA hydrolase